jgi:hypothetical protein
LDQGTEHCNVLQTMVIIKDCHGFRIMLKITVSQQVENMGKNGSYVHNTILQEMEKEKK